MSKNKLNASKESKDYEFCVLYNRKIISGFGKNAIRGDNSKEDEVKYLSLKKWYKNLTYKQKQRFNKELY